MRKFLEKFSSAGGSNTVQDQKNDTSHVAVIPVLRPETGDQRIPDIPPKASLEGLPVEIQSAVLLNIRDIASLKGLIHASPKYHSAYLSQRHAILKRVLFNSIHPDALYDAFSAINSSRTLTSNIEDRVGRVKAFLSEYKDNCDTWTSPEHLDLESAYRLARLQNQVQHATEDLCKLAFSSHQLTGNQVRHWEQLSSNESRRFYRAFYRFEIFCNLFRNWDTPPDDESLPNASSEDGDSTSELDSIEKSSRFLGLFNPWEVEELACVRDYFCSYYRRMLRKFEPELRDRNPSLDLSEDCPWLEENIEYLMALSLRFYRRLEMSSPSRQMRYLDYGLRSGPSFLSDALKEPPQAAVHQTLFVDDPVEVHFEADSVRGGPNVIWLLATCNRMDCSYFLWQNEPLREWGYVFWDQKRLEKWDVPNEEHGTWVERRRAGLRKALSE
ncbi:hypothetical protein HO133_003253 [Letharia lupina]|uniref:Uncharacterized protein n=1 Tax=Letharia lupina TaxID=560253 RepID=A0A8H6CAX4_9LECA|nr:uncharacterized protein HO133_003253 [Letharia lupina]KAF6220122.1 hypothetical protein HO133_003253 [Letharia lupina]